MKVLQRQFEKGGAGVVRLRCDEAEDMWHVYNIVQPGDFVTTSTIRKVVNESNTGSTTSKRVRLRLTIEVERTEFDGDSCVLRISGRCREENPYVKVGAYHTLALEVAQDFSITKQSWDAMHIDRLETAADPTKTSDLAAVAISLGLAHVCVVSAHMAITRARVEVAVPRKRVGGPEHARGVTRFFEAVYQAVLRHINLDKVSCCLLGGPGFVKDDFWAYLCSEAVRRGDRAFVEHKGKFVLCHASSGHRAAVDEMLALPAVQARFTDSRAAAEQRALDAFFTALRSEPDRALYGASHVERAVELLAVDTLLVTDVLFRNADVATRRRYVALVEAARAGGATVVVLSSLLGAGEQLARMTGVAAVLRFPLPEVAAGEMEEDSDSDDGAADANGAGGGGGGGGGGDRGRRGERGRREEEEADAEAALAGGVAGIELGI